MSHGSKSLKFLADFGAPDFSGKCRIFGPAQQGRSLLGVYAPPAFGKVIIDKQEDGGCQAAQGKGDPDLAGIVLIPEELGHRGRGLPQHFG